VLCCDYYCHYCTIVSLIGTIIGIIAEKEFCKSAWHSMKTEAKGIRHHRGLVFVVSVSRMDSIGDRQDDLDKPENNEDNCHKMNNILF